MAGVIRVVVIEDRVLMLNALRTSVNWAENDIEPIGFYESCDDALPFILEQCPDVVVTDIVMHGMTGIQLSEHLHQVAGDIKVIIISAYSRFGYAQKALQVGVFDYFEKPVDYQALVASIRRAGEERRHQEQMHEYIRNHMAFYRERFFTRLLLGQAEPEEIAQELVFLNLSLDGAMTAVSIRMRPEGDTLERGMRFEVLRLMLMNGIEEALGRRNVFGPFSLRGQDMTVVILGAFAQEALERVLRSFSEANWMVVHAGIGGTVEKPELLKESYDSACEAMDACFQFGETAVLRADELPDEGGTLWHGFFRGEETLFKALKQEDELQVRAVFQGLRETVSRLYTQRDSIQMLVKSILFKADAFQRQGDNAMACVLQSVDRAGTLEEMLGAAEAWCVAGLRSAQAEQVEQRRQVIRRINQYIEENYNNAKFSLNDVAKHMSMSPNYLSSMYKKECGRGIHDYLSELRIDKARELLVKTGRNIGEIGEAVGYVNPYYFSMSFKKITQFTPTEYRRRNAPKT